MQTPTQTNWLLYCRPGFERDCVQETQAKQLEALPGSGFAVVQDKPHLAYAHLTFARQLIRLHGSVDNLPERDRITPLLAALPGQPQQFGALWLEVPDTNEGKTLSSFTRRFQPLLEAALVKAGRLIPSPLAGEGQRERGDAVQHAAMKFHNGHGKDAASDNEIRHARFPLSNFPPHAGERANESLREFHANAPPPRLHIFFPDKHRALIGSSDPYNSAPWTMGILRQKMPHDSPSRSYLKLAEAFEVFLSKQEQAQWLKPGMHAVDLGAAPGGWTWQLVQRGLKVIAVDNGPLKGVAAEHPSIKHLRQDGFRYRPSRPVDWVVCDMVEQPQRVAALMAEWVASGLSNRAIFNLKLPMKKRVEALAGALDGVRTILDAKGMRYRLEAKQLYHDREEVTVYLARVKK